MDFEERKETWIDITKGLVIMLVVIGHTLESFMNSKLYVNYESIFNYVEFTLNSFHMPLFMMLSGYLYSKVDKLSSLREYKSLVEKKALNLIIPYFVFSIIQVGINIIFSSKVNSPLGIKDLLSIPFKPVLQFWFVYALMTIFLIVPLLDILLKNDKIVFILLLAIKIITPYVNIHMAFINYFFIWAFYFYCGKMLYNYFKYYIIKNYILIMGSISYVVLNVIFNYMYKGDAYSNIYVPSVIMAITGSILVIGIIKVIYQQNGFIKKVLYKVGKYSFQIYLLHIIFVSGIRMALTKILHIDSFSINFILVVGLGIACPALIGWFAEKVPVLNIFFYPGKYILKKKKSIKTEINNVQAIN